MVPPAQAGLFNLIVCNPPYVRHHHMDAGEKDRLQYATAAACGVRMAGLGGLYCYFLGLAHAWMAEGAIAGWLIPSEFMDVNYGEAVKRYLLNRVELLRIIGSTQMICSSAMPRIVRRGLGEETGDPNQAHLWN